MNTASEIQASPPLHLKASAKLPTKEPGNAMYMMSMFLGIAMALGPQPGWNEHVWAQEISPLEKGHMLFNKGKFEEALIEWQRVAQQFSDQSNQNRDMAVLQMLQGQAYRKLGHYQRASSYFSTVLEWSRKAGESDLMTQALNHLGAMAFEMGEREKALELLREGLRVAKDHGQASATAGILNSIGNFLSQMNRNNEALGAYTEAVGIAKSSNNHDLELIALINSAKAALEVELAENSEERLDLAMEKMESFADNHEKVNQLLTVGLLYNTLHNRTTAQPSNGFTASSPATGSRGGERGVQLKQGLGPPELEEILVVPEPDLTVPPFSKTEKTLNKSLRFRAYQAIQDARLIAHRIEDVRGESYACGQLGKLYEEAGQYAEALTLTGQAISLDQTTSDTDVAYRWQWQTARLQKNLGQLEEAQHAYQMAIEKLRPIRNEVSAAYQVRNDTFRQGVGTLYFELADLLLSRAKTASDPEMNKSLIVDARNTIEDFKAAELQDYFQEDCVQPSQTLSQTLQKASPKTAVIYPILLQDRTEIIVNFPSGLKQYTVSVPEKELTQQARQFRSVLQQPENLDFQKISETLYSWLMQPLEHDLQAEDIHTLVMVPDGALRSIPLSALYDGKEYLIEKYAIATTPGLTLTDPKPLARDSIKVLSLGITQAIQGFSPLPYVDKELKTLAGMYKDTTTLMNEDFVLPKMENQLKNEDYNIVHIASHGLVESDVKDTFLLAYDQKITMDRLAELVGLFRFRKAPLELLTLSACETAAGDDRAALGLAGVAVKAGARSALATLWFIDDAVASDLIGEFYKQLQNPALSKAQALQKAQVKILQQPQFHHPNFWSPFLLINNWL